MKVEGITQSLKKESHFSPKEKIHKRKNENLYEIKPNAIGKRISHNCSKVQTGAKIFCRKF